MQPGLLVVLVGALLAAATAHAAPAVITDRTFADSDWSLTIFTVGNGGDAEATQISFGNAAPSRRIRLTVNDAPSPTESSAVDSVHLFSGTTYDPQTQGPIATVDYFEDALLVEGFGDGQATGIALRQGGNAYIRQIGLTPDFIWSPKQDVGVPATGFVGISAAGLDPNAHPDFSSSGGPIEFGFTRRNSTSLGANGYTIVALIDNWTVLVNAPCTLDADCVYPAGCFTGACVAGACRATGIPCDDGNACTDDTCIEGSCQSIPIVCNDGDPCTTDACVEANGLCTTTPITCDDQRPCTADVCIDGGCRYDNGFDSVEGAIDTALRLLSNPPCSGDGLPPKIRKKVVKKLTKARTKVAAADAATKARLLARLVGAADRLLEAVGSVMGRAVDKGAISPLCERVLRAYVAGFASCADGLPKTP